MFRRNFIQALSAGLTASGSILAQTPARACPALQMITNNGQAFDIAQLKGKVVIVEFLLTHCPACQNCAKLMSKLQTEYGPKGLQIVGVAINDDAGLELNRFTTMYATTFPVGVKNLAFAQSFLQFPAVKRLNMPRLVFVDKKGMLRYHYGADEPWFGQEEANSRKIIEQLLAEGAKPASKSAAKKTST